MKNQKRVARWIIVPPLFATFVFAGCSTARPPSDTIAVAELGVQQARKSTAPQYAPLELRLAVDKLDQAKRAIENEDYTRARRLAEQALVDAQVAESKADSENARQRVRQTRQALETLRRELSRGS